MRASVIENGVVVNVIEVDSLDFMHGIVDAADADIGDTWDGHNFIKKSEPKQVPAQVTRVQAILALHNAGLLEQVEKYMLSNENTLTKLTWENTSVFERKNKTLLGVAAALGLSSETLDDIFIKAAQIIA